MRRWRGRRQPPGRAHQRRGPSHGTEHDEKPIADAMPEHRPSCCPPRDRLDDRGRPSRCQGRRGPLPGRAAAPGRVRSRPEGDTPGWRDEILTRSAAGRITNSSGGSSSTASPSIPPRTFRGTISTEVAVHARPGPWRVARRVEDEDPEAPAGEGGAGAGHERPIKRVGVVGDEDDRRVVWSRPRSSTMCSCGAARLGPSTACAVSSSVRSFASRYPGCCTASP